jgi:hypothetical protein
MNGPTARVGPFVCHCGKSASSPSGARWRRRVRPTLAVHRMAAPGDGSHSVSHPDVKKPRPQLLWTGFDLVGVAGFEPTTSSSRRRMHSAGGCRRMLSYALRAGGPCRPVPAGDVCSLVVRSGFAPSVRALTKFWPHLNPIGAQPWANQQSCESRSTLLVRPERLPSPAIPCLIASASLLSSRRWRWHSVVLLWGKVGR